MKILAKVLPGILALAFLGIGLLFMFNPAATLERLQLAPQDLDGWANIRSVNGGLFLGMAMLLVHGLLKGEGMPIRMVGILLALVALGRIVSLALDGFAGHLIVPIVVEIVLVAICLFSAKTLGSDTATS